MNTPRRLLYSVLWKRRRMGLRLRGLVLRAQIRLLGGRCGPRLMVGEGVRFKYPPHPGIQIGTAVHLGPHVVLDVPPDGRLMLGDRVSLTGYSVVAAAHEIVLGDAVLAGEFVSIRDADHGLAAGQLISQQPLATSPVVIGADVWLGRGVAVLKGCTVGAGAVIGANAVVTRSLPAGAIAVGSPARVIRQRTAPNP